MKQFALWTTTALLFFSVTGCTRWYNSSYADDPQQMKKRLTIDKTFCEQYIDQMFGRETSVDRINRDPTPQARALNTMNNWETDASREVMMQRCLKRRGWTQK